MFRDTSGLFPTQTFSFFVSFAANPGLLFAWTTVNNGDACSHISIKLRLDPEEFAPIVRLAKELDVTPEAVVYAGLHGIMRRAKEAEARKEIIAAHTGRHEGLPKWADDARSVHIYESKQDE